MSKDKPRPSLEDVARLAKVSPASVSRVFNNVQPTSERLRQQVEAAARQLGYLPKNMQRKTALSTLAILVPDLQNPYFTEIAEGIESRASELHLVTVLLALRNDAENRDRVLTFLPSITLGGCIILGDVIDERSLVSLAERLRCPVVIVNYRTEGARFRTVNIDYSNATYQIARHLLRLGHRRIIFLGAKRQSQTNLEKMEGLRRAMSEAGLELKNDAIYPGAASIEWGFQEMTGLLARERRERPTAVICSCDLVALGVLHAVRSSGLLVPRDVSVVGFDDIMMACHANPPLTTISPPKFQMGVQAVDLVMKPSRAGESMTDYVMMESPLVLRETVGAPPPDHDD